MRSALGPLLRQRFSVPGVVKWTLLLGGLYVVTGNGSLVAGLLTAAVISEAVDVLNAMPGVDERWVKAGFSVVFLGISGVWLWADLREPTTDGFVWIPIVAVGGGLWLLLDTRADFVQGRQVSEPGGLGDTDDLSSREAMRLIQHTSLVANHLSDEDPQTVPELAVDCGLTESRVREAIEIAGDDGTVSPVGEDAEGQQRYAVDDRMLGASGFGRMAAGGLSGVARRIVRPFVSQFPRDSRSH